MTNRFEADPKVPILLEPISGVKSTFKGNEDVYAHTDFDKRTDYFHIMPHEEPHSLRRREILLKHPEIKTLFVKDPISAWMAIGLVVLQITIAYLVSEQPWWIYLTCFYVIGASLNHTLHCLVHDLTHLTAFNGFFWNRLFAIFCNISQTFPSAILFGVYHRDHHIFLGRPREDPDLPTEWEIKFFNRPWKKFFYLLLQPVFYSIRPIVLSPKPMQFYEVLNFTLVLFCDYLIYRYLGLNTLFYLFLSGYFSIGLHPLAMHTIAEHYEFIEGLENTSYLGISNIPNLNLGYHIEHHDFPQVPWRLLPQIRKMAPEYYEDIPYHTSYLKVAYHYIFSKHIGPFSRIDVSRTKLDKHDAAALAAESAKATLNYSNSTAATRT